MIIAGKPVAPLALGGNVFGWTADEVTSFRILDAFVDAGGTMIDTADVYSAWAPGHVGGESETVIGNWLKRDPAKRDKVIIATKVGFMGGKIVDGQYQAALSPGLVRSGCEGSLQRLGIERIDLYYQHKDDSETPLTESLGAFEVLRREGKIAEVGLSNFEPARIEEALATAKAGGFPAATAVQGWYNLVERGKYEGALQEVVSERGLGFFPFYSLANGFLTGKYRSQVDISKSVRGGRNIEYIGSPKGNAVLAALEEVAAEIGAAMATVALAWTKAQPGISAPIASATSVEQAEQLIAAMTLDLTADQLQRLSDASD